MIEILKGHPDNTTLEEIQYHLYVRQKIERGIMDIEEGRTFTQEEMERRIEDDRISILGLIHGRRDFQTAWGEKDRE